MPCWSKFVALLCLATLSLSSFSQSKTSKGPENVVIGLDYDDDAVSFYFPGGDLYEYKLNGSDANWSSVKDSVLQFSNLAAGDYILFIRKRGASEQDSFRYPFRVESSARTNWELIGGVSGLMLLSLFLFYKFYTATLQNVKQSKAELKQKLVEMEMKALRAQMSPHFIFNSLNSINRYIVKSDPETASAYLTKFAKLIRLILENSNHKIISLEQELNALKLYIELEAFRFNKKFSYSLSVSPDVDSTTLGIPPMVIQPFIENAIWHGLLHKDSPGNLQISIVRSGNGIQCVILDNGVGRKKASELKSKSVSQDKSFGMKITADRLNMIRGNNKISTVEIVDLEDEQGKASGTKVILEIAPAILEEF